MQGFHDLSVELFCWLLRCSQRQGKSCDRQKGRRGHATDKAPGRTPHQHHKIGADGNFPLRIRGGKGVCRGMKGTKENPFSFGQCTHKREPPRFAAQGVEYLKIREDEVGNQFQHCR